jgi:hypothetical protein
VIAPVGRGRERESFVERLVLFVIWCGQVGSVCDLVWSGWFCL